jgi:hypothetical protein
LFSHPGSFGEIRQLVDSIRRKHESTGRVQQTPSVRDLFS